MITDRRALDIEAGEFQLSASLWRSQSVIGVVIVAQPCGLDRLLAEGGHVLEELRAQGYAVLALGLLNAVEECSDELASARRFDIEELSNRLIKAIDWLVGEGFAGPIGVLASGTAAAAALISASRRRIGAMVSAIVSIDGRPDLAVKGLHAVQCPTLFLVGAGDAPGLAFSQIAADRMHCARELQAYAAVGSLGAEPKSAAAKLAVGWFARYLKIVEVREEAQILLGEPQSAASTPRYEEPEVICLDRDKLTESSMRLNGENS